jgi:hypothetical protein
MESTTLAVPVATIWFAVPVTLVTVPDEAVTHFTPVTVELRTCPEVPTELLPSVTVLLNVVLLAKFQFPWNCPVPPEESKVTTPEVELIVVLLPSFREKLVGKNCR